MSQITARGPRITAEWLNAKPLRKVFAAFETAHIDVCVVGGAIRNSLIDRPVTDVDLATPAAPETIIRLAKDAGLDAHPTGIEHGTVTLVSDGVGFEVTTLRRDIETDGRHATVAFTQSWEDDAKRRDFTINALYCDADGMIYDPIGGLDDLRRRRVRFIGDAEARIREDYLRILRFFRFSAQYGKGQLDAVGLAAAIALKQGLTQLAAERIRAEFLKLLAAPFAAEVVLTMHESGILKLILPGMTDPGRLARLQAIEANLGQPPDVICGLAALAVSNPAKVDALAQRLRLSNAEAAALKTAAIVNPDIDPAQPDTAARAVLYHLGPEAFRRAVYVSWARSGAAATDPAWRRRALLADRWSPPKMPFGGSDVLALGVPPGPAVGDVLKAFETWWVASDFIPDRSEQAAKLKALAASAVH
ncbi:polynucleotide adenylyltransferase region [Hyphomicrobium denitrificans 1NES1]|uniref:Polynucleotide adenylyltransferase region n=1 Tax=Hyphomicrobium denitrificans 1NES1 TaxID=670307 RepID=N0B9K8_9HYPH|nr:CCA tRNA nucleotidyltransferase [Hyphomicrobium denitrificans]AGK58927.1 polynucleotide adenylyltransferase region [Hyphomicrobium denitrificans 1NES1]